MAGFREKPRAFFYFTVSFFVLLAVLGLVMPRGACSLVMQIMVFSIFAMGYDLCLGFTDQCSLGHSIFFGAGAYGFLLAILWGKLGVGPALFLGVAAGLIITVPIALICVRLSEAYFVIVTAIFGSIFHLFAMDLTWLTGGDDGLSVSLKPISLGLFKLNLYDLTTSYYFCFFCFLISYLLLKSVTRSPLGRILVCLRENPKRTQFLGYNVLFYKFIALVISGLFTGFSGALYAMTLRYASADFFQFYWAIIPVVWCLVGGLGSLIGPCLGVVLMSLFQYYVSAWFMYYLIIFGVLVLIILKVSKKGLVGFVFGRVTR